MSLNIYIYIYIYILYVIYAIHIFIYIYLYSLYDSRMKLTKSAQWEEQSIILGQDKNQLLYTTSSFMQE